MVLAQMGELFAQAGRAGGAGAAGADEAAGAGGMVGGLVCVGLYVALLVGLVIVQIFYLLSMSRALKAVAPRNRTMEPGQVWFVFIPIAGIIFAIMMLFKIPESIKNEYEDRGLRGDGDYGKTLALWYLITMFLCGPVGLVLWIMFWLKINSYTKELNESSPRSGGRLRGGDDDEDRPRPRRRDEDDDEDDDRPRRGR